MDKKTHMVRVSKFLSYVLRHDPGRIGLTLDRNGWADVADLLQGACHAGLELTEELIAGVVRHSDKKRFALSDDGLRIRANYGHTVHVELDMEPCAPPDILYHGTATRFLESIRRNGLQPKGRSYVHLSGDRHTAGRVGSRHGKPVILEIEAGKMYAHGFEFILTPGGIWLSRAIPLEYICFPD
jgi:putative RNA 2'-phosphotransferase